MVEQYLKYNENINNQIDIINQMSSYLFDKIFVYIIIILSIIFILIKNKFILIKPKKRITEKSHFLQFGINICNYIKKILLNGKNNSLKNSKMDEDGRLTHDRILIKENRRKKGNNYTVDNIIKNRKYLIFNLINIIIINLFCYISCININLINSQSSSITLTIKGTGYIHIFNPSFDSKLCKVIINDDEINISDNKYNFTNTTNKVKLIWDESLTTCESMFEGCDDITEINLSNFDTSNVISMGHMFHGCSSLNSLNLSNLNTSRVESMSLMFFGCSSLVSLDLSYFDTSKVEKMHTMFEGCSHLESLNLSNFNTSNVLNMDFMFSYCKSLISLNISSFNM